MMKPLVLKTFPFATDLLINQIECCSSLKPWQWLVEPLQTFSC